MPKKSKAQVREDEQKIIKRLMENADGSIDRIAKTCGFSRQKLWRILKRLEQEKSIWGYTVAAEDKKLGVNTYIALAKSKGPFTNAEDPINIVKDDLAAQLGILLHDIHYLHGIYDWAIVFTARDISVAKKFCNHLQKAVPDIGRIDLLESLFPLMKSHMVNPNIEKLKEFTGE